MKKKRIKKPVARPSSVAVGTRLMELRESKNILRSKAARDSRIDLSNYSRIEGGKINVTVDTLFRILKALGCKMQLIPERKKK